MNNQLNNNPNGQIVFYNYDYKKASIIIHAVHHKLRQEIIKVVENNPNIIVTEIYKKLRVEQSTCSQHLAVLRRVGILKTIKQGKNVMYSVNYKRIEDINHCVNELIKNAKD